MATDSTWDVQAAVFARLCSDTALTSLLAAGADSVLDHVPSGTIYPYIVLGETRAEPLDTSANAGFEIVLTIHSYSLGAGMGEVRQIMSALHESLHNADFAVPNQNLILCRMLDSETRLELDGKTRHGIQRFQIITEAV